MAHTALTEKSRWNLALTSAAALVWVVGCAAWVFPREAASAVGTWVLPALSVAGLALALGLAADWRWLRGLLVVLAATLVLAWIKVPESTTSTTHLAGASLGLLLMLIVGRVVDTPQRLRLAMLTLLGGGFVALVLAFAGADHEKMMRHALASIMPVARLGLSGMEGSGDINPNALAAVALLVTPLGACILLLGRREKVDVLGLRPLGFVVFVAGVLVLALSRSRTAWMAIWLTLAALLVRGLRSWAWRLPIGTAVLVLPLLAFSSMHLDTQDEFVLKASNLWVGEHDRAHVMMSGVERLRESPWLGIGLNQFRHVYKPPPGEADYDVAHAHNMFLQTALDVGVFGLAAYCGVLGFLLIRADQIAQGPSTLSLSAAVGAALSLVAVSMFGLGDAVALGAKIGMFQWMAGGLILGAWRTQFASKDHGVAKRPSQGRTGIPDAV